MGQENYVELAGLQTKWLKGAASITVDGPNLIFCMYQEQIGGDGAKERVIVGRYIMAEADWLVLRDATEIAIAGAGHAVPVNGHVRSSPRGLC